MKRLGSTFYTGFARSRHPRSMFPICGRTPCLHWRSKYLKSPRCSTKPRSRLKREVPIKRSSAYSGQAKLRVQRAKIAARDLQTLKSAAVLVSRNLGEIEDLKSDLARLERELESTGSLKTVDDVQREVDQIANEMCDDQSR